jgi:predicted ATPase
MTIKKLLEPLEDAMGGKVELKEPQGFYLIQDGVRTEMHLVAEGLRKLATIARLIVTGQLIDHGYLFWDEPESNLNPKIVKVVAESILELCRAGIQVFVATHSLFLMRELDILLRGKFQDVPARFFGLHPSDQGVTVQQGDTVDEISSIDALDEELIQSDRYRDSVEAKALFGPADESSAHCQSM